jgi:ketosteroid isomerase-like protein
VAAAFDARDADAYVGHMTEDVIVRPPGFMLGQRELHGRAEVRAAFAELGEGLNVTDRRYFVDRADQAKFLVVYEINVSRERGDELATYGSEAALVITLTGDKVSRLHSVPSEAEGLAQLADPVAVDG